MVSYLVLQNFYDDGPHGYKISGRLKTPHANQRLIAAAPISLTLL